MRVVLYLLCCLWKSQLPFQAITEDSVSLSFLSTCDWTDEAYPRVLESATDNWEVGEVWVRKWNFERDMILLSDTESN